MGRKLVIAHGGKAKQVQNYRIVLGGVVKDIVRACVTDNGLVREFHPAGDPVDPPAPRIVFNDDPITVAHIVDDPATATAEIGFSRITGEYSYRGNPFANVITDDFLNPPLSGLAPDNDLYIIRVDQLSGVPITGATPSAVLATWIDLNADTALNWRIIKSVVGTDQATANITIAESAGGLTPLTGTEVVKPVVFTAEVVDTGGSGSDIAWDDVEESLEDVRQGIDGLCSVDFATNGTSVGAALTGSFSLDWSVNAPAEPNPENFTVECDVLVGDAPTGDALNTQLALSTGRGWSLPALSGEDKSNTCVYRISDGNITVNKVIHMHSQNIPISNDLVWTSENWLLLDLPQGAGLESHADIFVRATGITDALTTGDTETEDWHTDAPAPADNANYECCIYQSGGTGDQVTGDLSAAPAGHELANWFSLDVDRNVHMVSAAGVIQTRVFEVSVRPVGQGFITKQITIQLGRFTGIPP